MITSIPRDKLDGFRAHLDGLPVKVTVEREQRGVRLGRVRINVKVELDARRKDTRAEGRDAMGAVMRALEWAAGEACTIPGCPVCDAEARVRGPRLGEPAVRICAHADENGRGAHLLRAGEKCTRGARLVALAREVDKLTR